MLREKLAEAEEDSRQLVQVWEHLQRIPDFKTLRKQERELWMSVQGIKKRHFDTERRKGGNWTHIRQKVGDTAVTLLQEHASSWTYSGHLRILFAKDINAGARRLVAAVKLRLENVRSGVSAERGVMPGDAGVARNLEDVDFTDEELALYHLSMSWTTLE